MSKPGLNIFFLFTQNKSRQLKYFTLLIIKVRIGTLINSLEL